MCETRIENTTQSILHDDVLEYITECSERYDLTFIDPPDNIGLKYGNYVDKLSSKLYYANIKTILHESLRFSATVWLSYYWEHDLEIKYIVRNLLKHYYKATKAKTFIWRFTFGQYKQTDCGSGFRYLLRLTRPSAQIYPDAIREMSERQRLCDKRADPRGRVPDDVWEFSRVVCNSSERRSWHPTQHPEKLMERIMLLSTVPGDKVLDLFSGTGTTLRVCKKLNRTCVGIECDQGYVSLIRKEL